MKSLKIIVSDRLSDFLYEFKFDFFLLILPFSFILFLILSINFFVVNVFLKIFALLLTYVLSLVIFPELALYHRYMTR